MIYFKSEQAKDFFASFGELLFGWVLVTVILKAIHYSFGISAMHDQFCSYFEIVYTLSFVGMYLLFTGTAYLFKIR